MGAIRRSSLQVYLDFMARLKVLEKQRKSLEKDAADTASPFHWAALKAIAEIAIMIASIIRQLKRPKRKKK